MTQQLDLALLSELYVVSCFLLYADKISVLGDSLNFKNPWVVTLSKLSCQILQMVLHNSNSIVEHILIQSKQKWTYAWSCQIVPEQSFNYGTCNTNQSISIPESSRNCTSNREQTLENIRLFCLKYLPKCIIIEFDTLCLQMLFWRFTIT